MAIVTDRQVREGVSIGQALGLVRNTRAGNRPGLTRPEPIHPARGLIGCKRQARDTLRGFIGFDPNPVRRWWQRRRCAECDV
jgi:hypothetical protein